MRDLATYTLQGVKACLYQVDVDIDVPENRKICMKLKVNMVPLIAAIDLIDWLGRV